MVQILSAERRLHSIMLEEEMRWAQSEERRIRQTQYSGGADIIKLQFIF